MGDFLKSRRRAAGLVTLIATGVLTVAWFRSFQHEDAYFYPTGPYLTDSFFSAHGAFGWRRDDESVWDIPRDSPDYGFHTRRYTGGDGLLYSEVKNWQWSWHPGPFRTASGEDSSGGYARIWTVPYWTITSPLIVISMYLLIGNSRRKTVGSDLPD